MSEPQRTQAAAPIEMLATGAFTEWLAAESLSLALTTYQTNRLFLVGVKPEGKLSAFERLLDRPMGVAVGDRRLWVATRYQIWRFDDTLAAGETHGDYDRLFVPRRGHVTSEVDAHDLAIDGAGDVIFANTLYSCLSRLSDRHSFAPLWRPPFVSRLAPEDRCHLNGLALADGNPRWVTACSRSDVAGGWRDRRSGGGVLLEVPSGEVVADGLSMPHSPRFHQGALWVLDSGRGELARIDPATGDRETVAFLPGFLRGLAFHGPFAFVGLSKPRHRTFQGLPLAAALEQRDADPKCGVFVVDTRSGNVVHRLELEGLVQELYDIQLLPGTRCPSALGFRSDEIRRVVTFEEEGRVVRHALSELEEGDQAPTGAPVPLSARPAAPAAGTGAAATKAPVAAPAASPGVVFQLREATVEQVVALAGHLTFPDLARTASGRALREPLIAAIALADGQLAGLALAERREGGQVAEVCSLAVRPDRRRQGIAHGLIGRLEEGLARRGTGRIGLAVRSTWPGATAVQRILARRGWMPPRRRARLSRADAAILEAPWFRDRPLPAGWEIFPWEELAADERRDIVRRQQEGEWFPPVLTPFQGEERLEPLTSLGLRQQGRVAGWLVTHRVSEDTVQYSSLFVEPGARRRAQPFALLVEAIRRQHEAGVPYGIFLVAEENTPMQRILAKRLGPWLTHQAEILWSQKTLATG